MTTKARGRDLPTSTLGHLLTSGTRAKLLIIFLTQPSREYYLRELARRTGRAVGAVQHELPRLELMGLIKARRRGREKFYQANANHPIYPELRRIVYKTAALGDLLRDVLNDVEGMEAAFIFGSVAEGREEPRSAVDLMIIGKPSLDRVHASLKDAEDAMGREVSLTTMSKEEWIRRLTTRDGFAREVMRSEKIFLVGDERNLRRS
ncbi:MAG: hypothetical protein ACRDF5_05660 [bacterium]